ncbi:hypothetical protein G9274_003221 [Stenotrophomonas rhizophila]|nr:hypothetical protein G9274_003221 [Stenotrophomonas rhizophila]
MNGIFWKVELRMANAGLLDIIDPSLL